MHNVSKAAGFLFHAFILHMMHSIHYICFRTSKVVCVSEPGSKRNKCKQKYE